jgi:SAM-dependent methyltransferase
MFQPNAAKLLASLAPTDVVLDIGGWACPFNRANYVMDAEPYETRGFYKTVGLPASQGGDREFFSKDTWIRRDICGREPYPFADRSVDCVICSHVLEDVRDPLWVCSEIVRIGKRGYIEIPSRLAESCRGWESDRIAGLTHHRWLIDVDQERADLRFLMKHHMIHADRRFSLPRSFYRRLPEEKRVSWLFWDGTFSFSERTIHGLTDIAAELEGFVRRSHRYPGWVLAADRLMARGRSLVRRVTDRAIRGRS